MNEMEQTRMAGSLVDFLESLGYSRRGIEVVSRKMVSHLIIRDVHEESVERIDPLGPQSLN